MPYQANVINVMIASPSDVAPERSVIQDVIHSWNSLHSDQQKIVLLPVMWETHSNPEMGNRAQAIINRQVLEKGDLLVAVFWTRLGSPTGESPSGTVEEIRKHLAAGKPAMIYFSHKPVDPDSVDPAQYSALKAFRQQCEREGLIEKYASIEELRVKLPQHLARVIRDKFPSDVRQKGLDSHAGATPAQLSEEAQRLLTEAVRSAQGSIFRYGVRGHKLIKVGMLRMTGDNSPRDQAKWNAGVSQLLEAKLIEKAFLKDRGHDEELYTVTEMGYTTCDKLRSVNVAPSSD